MAHRIIGFLVALGFVLVAAGAQAQNYDPIRDETGKTQELIEELNTLVDAAERSRAADRRFIRDLRNVLRRFDNPWQVRLLTEDFRDGDFQSNPAWIVESGEFFNRCFRWCRFRYRAYLRRIGRRSNYRIRQGSGDGSASRVL